MIAVPVMLEPSKKRSEGFTSCDSGERAYRDSCVEFSVGVPLSA